MKQILKIRFINFLIGNIVLFSSLFSSAENTIFDNISILKQQLNPLSKKAPNYTPILQWINNKPYVLIGDSTHGSHEFYRSRIEITKKLISEKGFNTIVIEGNWPPTYQLNQFIHNQLAISVQQVLNGFKTASPWLWNNREMAEFISWLRDYNLKNNNKVSIYGMDIYSLYESIDKILVYLTQYYPAKLEQAYKNIACFKKVAKNAKDFLIKSRQAVKISCDQQARNIYQLIKDINLTEATILEREAYFNATMNASVIDAAAFFFRLTGQPNSFNTWNLREYFMLGQVNQIINHQTTKHGSDKIVVWAHNSHVGNSSATERTVKGEVSLGYLFRQYLGEENVYLIGQLTYQGQVIASNQWNGQAYCMSMPKAKKNSYGDLFNQTSDSDFMLQLGNNPAVTGYLNSYEDQRMVGVVYNPLLDSFKNYLLTDIKQQFDAILFIKNTNALEPLYPYYGCNLDTN